MVSRIISGGLVSRSEEPDVFVDSRTICSLSAPQVDRVMLSGITTVMANLKYNSLLGPSAGETCHGAGKHRLG